MTRQIVVLVVALLAVFAGCNGGVLDGDSPEQANATGAPADGDPSDQADPTDAPSVSEQAWVDDNGVLFERLVERHHSVMTNASSFERVSRVSSSEGGETSASFALDRSSRRFFLDIATTVEDTEHVQETFFADEAMYSKSGTAAEPEYNSRAVSEEEYEQLVDSQTRAFFHPSMLSQWDFEYAGYESGAYHFEADSATPEEYQGEFNFDLENATATNATLVVDERGFVRQLTLSATMERDGESVWSRVTFEVSGVNETTVSEPSWTEKAGSE